MRKTWVKRENIYYKPFYKQKSKMLLLAIFLLAIIFFMYQVVSISQLPNTSTPWSLESTMQGLRREKPKEHTVIVDDGGGRIVEENKRKIAENGLNIEEKDATEAFADDSIKIIRGIRLFDYDSYKPNFEGKFVCLDGSATIPFEWVNDDYCDCNGDGSDEPSTNACSNGHFYCRYQKRHITGRGRDQSVRSSRINDGVCDCCDGSDEWTTTACQNKCT